MDKNAIKKYAVWARRELISRVSQRAALYDISEEGFGDPAADSVRGRVLTPTEKQQRQALIAQIQQKGYREVMEEVAYTWFNRFAALRFMEVNRYLPTHVRVFTDDAGEFNPKILTEAIDLELEGLDKEKVYQLKNADKKEELYKLLLITQCNALSGILPGMFQRIADYTELLFPDNLLRKGSVIQQMIELIPEKDWTDQVQIIGWLYQYYNSEKKDEVFAALKKNVKITKENIPAATQLFTPDWIVRYMVENSLGRLWVEHNAGSARDEYDERPGDLNELMISRWKYYLFDAPQDPEVQAQMDAIRKECAALTPEQIKCIDPCCGSGHILAYMFDVLMQIYQSYGYTTQEAVASIVAHNLYGLDIDDRAAQLSYFAVMMKARQYDRRFLTRKDEDGNPDVPQPYVYAICESNTISRGSLKYFGWSMSDIERNMALDQMTDLLDAMQDAKEYGSILIVKDYDWELLYRFVGTVDYSGQLDFDAGNLGETKEKLWRLVEIAAMLAQKYDVVVTNPPYIGSPNMGNTLLEYIKDNYEDSKADLYAAFIERNFVFSGRYVSMITQSTWMFQARFEKIREKLYEKLLICMNHLGTRAFDEINGEVVQTTAFCYMNSNYIANYNTSFINLTSFTGEDAKESAFFDPLTRNVRDVGKFRDIPGEPFAYYISDIAICDFRRGSALREKLMPKQGTSTGDDEMFVRYWFEPSYTEIGFNYTSTESAHASCLTYFPIDKGGTYRKWYGNNDRVIRFDTNSYNRLLEMGNRLPSRQYYFREGLTWSKIASELSVRYSPVGFVFSSVGLKGFPAQDDMNYILSFMNSKVCQYFVKVISPGMSIVSGDIEKLPLLDNPQQEIDNMCDENIKLSRIDWDSFETSWDFQRHPLISVIPKNRLLFDDIDSIDLAECYMCWENECETRFQKLKANEEELNRIFIDIYGLQNELTPEVEDRDVTVRKADLQRDIKSLISYAVGCMFGRYSLNRSGLVYAGGEWEDTYRRNALAENGDTITFGGVRIAVNKGYQIQVDGQWLDCTYSPDTDNIIPICDDEYFEDDIVGRFIKFIETVYGKQSLESNLRFIADALGGKGQPKEVIRSYFLNDFFNDHCKIYQKRPIYWQFDSGKKNGFKCLIYMHRYQPDTIARIRTDYVHEQQSRYRTAIADLENRIAAASTSERVKLNKQLKKLQEQAAEVHVYEEKIHHLADQMIPIDLDDGVKHNYEIFKDVLAKIK